MTLDNDLGSAFARGLLYASSLRQHLSLALARGQLILEKFAFVTGDEKGQGAIGNACINQEPEVPIP